jgi:DHA2 family multidrug resistance protein
MASLAQAAPGGAAEAAPAEAPVSLRTWVAVLGCILGAFMAILDIGITNASMNEIQGALNATLEEGSWLSTAYLVAEIIVIPMTGWFSEVFSTRRYLLANVALFLVFSTLCATAWDMPSMDAFRALQGFTGGVLIPVAMTVVLGLLPPSKQPIGMALFGIATTFAPSLGPTLGGWLTDNYGWPLIFLINWAPGLLMLAMLGWAMPGAPMKLHLLRRGDWWGLGTLAVGLAALEIVLEEGQRHDWFGSAMITRMAVLAVLALAAFLAIELRRKEPFINLRLLARRNFLLASFVSVALGLALYGSGYLMSVYLASIQGYNAFQNGLVSMWLGFPQLLIMPFLPLLMARLDARWLVAAGALLFGGSCWVNGVVMTHQTGADQLLWINVMRAFGQALMIVPLTAIATAGIAPSEMGSASALYNMLRNLGGSVGIALLSTLLTRREQLHSARLGEAVSAFSQASQARLDQLAQALYARSGDLAGAQAQAAALIGGTVRREAYVLAFADGFVVIGLILIGAVVALAFMRGVGRVSMSAGH